MHAIPAALMLGSLLVGQQEPKSPRPMVVEPIGKDEVPGVPAGNPQPAAPAATPGAAIHEAAAAPDAPAQLPPGLFVEPTAVVYDTPQDGQVWALAPAWKAGFSTQGATFVPFFGSDAPANRPATFQVVGAAVGRVALPIQGLAVVQNHDCVSITRQGFREQYRIGLPGIEQQFVFENLPQRGALSVDLAVAGDYQVGVDGGELRFACELGSFRYGAAKAIDARGRTVPMTTEWHDGVLRLVVPADFVATAQLPLVIDPLIGNVATLATSVPRYGATDLAYDSSLAMHVACYERVFSQADSDVFGLRLDANHQPIGSAFSIDITTTAWRSCRIANLNAYDKFLVVAESEVAPNPIAIAGRVYLAGSHLLGSQFDIERGTRSCIRPDVGGDPSLSTPTYWTVVFERRYSAVDGDIMMRQVTESGALRGTGMTTVDASTLDHERPVISRSNGNGTSSQQVWLVSYLQAVPGINVRIEGRFVSWDGQFLGNLSPFPFEITGPRRWVAVSSPTAVSAGKLFVLVLGVENPVTSKVQLGVRAVTSTGVSAAYSLALTDGTVDCTEPSVETDGSRFVFSFARRTGAAGREIVARTYDLPYNPGGGVLPFQLRDEAVFGNSTGEEVGLALCSRYTGGTAGLDDEYAMLFGQQGVANSALLSTRYLGFATQGGLAMRPTGCGQLAVQVTTSTHYGALGSTNTATVQNPTGLVGWVIGAPTSLPVAGCAGCTQGSSATVTLLGPQTQLYIPSVPAFVGVTFALQAFAFGPGSCFGSLALSDTADLTIR